MSLRRPATQHTTVAGPRAALCLLACATLLACAPSPPDSRQGAAQPAQTSTPRRLVAAIHGTLTQLSRGIDAAGSGNTDGLPEVEGLVNVGLARIEIGRASCRERV